MLDERGCGGEAIYHRELSQLDGRDAIRLIDGDVAQHRLET